MKNSINVVAIILVLFVLGCSCPLANLGKKGSPTPERPSPGNSTPSATRTPGSSDKVLDLTLAKFKQLKDGMSRSEVERILGGPGEEISRTSGGGVEFSVNKWSGEDYTSIIISFRDDKIMTKSQVGLK